MKVFIGHDERLAKATEVCEKSMKRHAPNIDVRVIDWNDFDIAGVYDRPHFTEDGQYYDTLTGSPFSTQFSFTRFLVPHLTEHRGWAVFCDSDFVWRGDIRSLFDLADERFAVMVVPHNHGPPQEELLKMDGVVQTRYWRKNWSSLILWNCSHGDNLKLTPKQVNDMPGLWLHQFQWVQDGNIGVLPEEWNYLVGKTECISPTTHYRQTADIMGVHFTEGTPNLPGYENAPYADEWRMYA